MCLTPRLIPSGNKLNLPNYEFKRNETKKLEIDEALNDVCDYISPEQVKDLISKPENLSVLQLNVRGLINKQEDLIRLINQGGKNKVNVVLLCETWLRKDTVNKVKIPGYSIVNKIRQGKKGGGVSILIDNQLHYRERPDLTNPNSQNFESLCIELKTNSSSLIVLSGYRAPNNSEVEFIKEYTELLVKIKKTGRKSIIGLDHNLDLLKCDIHKKSQEFLELNIDSNLSPCITKPTRITHQTATLIDNVFGSLDLQQKCISNIIIEDISDHLPCLCVFRDIHSTKKASKKTLSRKLNEKKLEAIASALDNIDWHDLLNLKKCESQYSILHEQILQCFDKHAPLRPTNSKVEKCREPWLTTGIIKCIRKQKELYRKSIRVDNLNVTTGNVKRYNEYKTVLQRVKRHCKRAYFQQKCVDLKNNTKKLWQLINNMVKQSDNKQNLIPAMTINGIKEYDSNRIANELGHFFAEIGSKLASKTATPKTKINDYIGKIQNNEKSLYLYPTNEPEIRKLLRELPNKTSAGHDGISNISLKALGKSLGKPLQIVFNNSLKEGVVPNLMKLADVVPLYKSKAQDVPTNYRPISLLITISKLLEKIVYKRTYGFLEKYHILYKSQYGFRKHRSCEQAICELIGEVIKGKEQGMYTAAIFLDLSKAFDSLDHTILLQKLERYGIRGHTNKWFANYLKDRKLRVKCNTEFETVYSDYYSTEFGTPQGSCLGPLLFLLFANDLYLNLDHCKCILFADDTTIYFTHRNKRYLEWCLQEDIKNINDWFKANKLTLNVDKSVCMIFNNNKKNKASLSITIDGSTLPVVTTTKFLGIWLDVDLNWQTHLKNLRLKLLRNIHLLKKTKNLLDIATKRCIYYAHIHSHIAYGIIVWGNMLSKCHLNKLQKLQNNCIKEILKRKININDYRLLKMLRISELIKLENIKLAYRTKHSQLPEKVQTACRTDSRNSTLVKAHRYNTRQKLELNLPRASTTMYKNSFLFQSTVDYQKLPLEIKKISQYASFVRKGKEFLLSNPSL